MEQPVEFPSQGAILRGRLFMPSAAVSRPPIVIMAHGFSATVDGMVADRYAEAFAAAGVAALLYDHLGFGRSGGEPRQRLDRWLQVIGYRDAIAFVTTLDSVDGSRLGLWGDSRSGACVLVAAAFDERVRAVVTQVPALGDELPASDNDEALLNVMATLYARPELGPPSGPIEGPMPVVSPDQLGSPSALTPLTAYRWFMEYGGRYGSSWQNWVTSAHRDGIEPFQAALCAAKVECPALFVVAAEDEMPGANSGVARRVFDLLAGPRQLIDVDGGHFGLLYHPSPLFDEVSRAECDFLVRYLVADSRSRAVR